MAYTEADTRANKSSHWLESRIVREYYFTDGRKLIGGKRGQQYYVDYLLVYDNINLTIIEAKVENKDLLDGLQQSINYAQKLKFDFVYATNGHKIYEHNLITGKGHWVDNFPTPQTLFERKFPTITSITEKIIKQPFHFEWNMKPRYYLQIAEDKTLEPIANGKVLLMLATIQLRLTSPFR